MSAAASRVIIGSTSCGGSTVPPRGPRLLQNLFLPSVKLVRKDRVGARVRRRYDAPRTPFERVVDSPQADPAAVAQLTAVRARLDPFALAQTIERKLEQIYALAHHPARPAAPSLSAAPLPPPAAVAPVVPRPRARLRPLRFGKATRAPLPRHHLVTS